MTAEQAQAMEKQAEAADDNEAGRGNGGIGRGGRTGDGGQQR